MHSLKQGKGPKFSRAKPFSRSSEEKTLFNEILESRRGSLMDETLVSFDFEIVDIP